MTSITDPNMSNGFTSAMDEIHNTQLKTYGEIIDMTAELCQSHRQFVKSALDMCLKKCKDDEMLFETIQMLKRDLVQKKASLKGKRHAVSEMISEIQQKEMQKDDIIQKIEKLKEEQAKRKELMQSQNKANKNRLRNLQKARVVFQDHLGMEMRTILGKTQLVKGEKLQFVFRNINPSDQESAYVVTMGIKEDGSYQIVSSDPVLECLPVLESQLQETNNLAAFLANVRKEFISQARC
ncbi:kinetochore protein Spc25 [Anarrhichthys ocellatus]|uniref:kinetochore protein Spc25 n=1 Tax=Anarrhichthys ocellatus TaxID=433405 RepID=UPI0012EE40D4|nr:kinetochore protein Spc25 [Anarrhichthys ocellatus]